MVEGRFEFISFLNRLTPQGVSAGEAFEFSGA
jgi:hypothetical protein